MKLITLSITKSRLGLVSSTICTCDRLYNIPHTSYLHVAKYTEKRGSLRMQTIVAMHQRRLVAITVLKSGPWLSMQKVLYILKSMIRWIDYSILREDALNEVKK